MSRSCYKIKDAILFNADCMDILPTIENDSVAAVIIDPPYGGQTHNQQDWDKMWSAEVWDVVVSNVFRLLMPGGHFVVFAGGSTMFEIRQRILAAYGRAKMPKPVSSYQMAWRHFSYDSGRVHSHTPRSQFENILVFYRQGEGKLMASNGLLCDSYNFNQHVGRGNLLEFYKDDCRSKPFPTIQEFFKAEAANGKHLSTFDYKPEALLRALIHDLSSPGQTILDFCMRHGIAAVASLLECRRFIGVELNEEYYERAKSRMIEQFGSAESPRTVVLAPPASLPYTASPYASDGEPSIVRLGSGLGGDDDVVAQAGVMASGGAVASKVGVYATAHAQARAPQYVFVGERKSDGRKPHAEAGYEQEEVVAVYYHKKDLQKREFEVVPKAAHLNDPKKAMDDVNQRYRHVQRWMAQKAVRAANCQGFQAQAQNASAAAAQRAQAQRTAPIATSTTPDSPSGSDPANIVAAGTPAKRRSTYRCDKCDTPEICDVRFHMMGSDYDVCQECFDNPETELDRSLFRRHRINAPRLLLSEPSRASERRLNSPDTSRMAKKPRGRPPKNTVWSDVHMRYVAA